MLKVNYSKYKHHGNAEQKRDNKSDHEYLRQRDRVDRKAKPFRSDDRY